MELTPIISSPSTSPISSKQLTPSLHCERRSFDYVPSRFLIPASSEGYLVLFANDSNTILALDVATDDWCAIETSGFERIADDAPVAGVCAYAKLYVIGQSSPDDKAKKKAPRFNASRGGCEVKVQCFDFASRKWSRIGAFSAPTNCELIAAAVAKKYENQSKLSIFVLCTNGQLIETAIDAQLSMLLSVHRFSIHNAPPLLNAPGATIDEHLGENEWKWLERRAFVDTVGCRLLWLGISNCSYDTLHILNLAPPVARQWSSIRIPRNDRGDLWEIDHRHTSRVAYLPLQQRLVFFLSDTSDEAVLADALVPEPSGTAQLSKTEMWTVSLSELDHGWVRIVQTLESDITRVSGGEFNELYCLGTTILNGQHKQQNLSRLFFGVPSLRFLSFTAVINALDPKTKRIQRRQLVEQLGKVTPTHVVEAFWYRTKMDRGVLRQLSKGIGFYGEYAKDDDQVPFWRKMIARLTKR